MIHDLVSKLETYIRKYRRTKRWNQIMAVLIILVVFCTTYALMAPAITMEKECEIQEHTHSDACYNQVTTTTVGFLFARRNFWKSIDTKRAVMIRMIRSSAAMGILCCTATTQSVMTTLERSGVLYWKWKNTATEMPATVFRKSISTRIAAIPALPGN